MEQLELAAEKRMVTGKQVKQLRNQGVIPAIVFGHTIGSIPIQVEEKELRAVLGRAGTNRLITIKIAGEKKPRMVLAREVQRNPIKGSFLHVDFQAVVMTEKIRTNVTLNFVNESPAVRNSEGMLLHNLDSIEVESLPSDLLASIDVDLSVLEAVDDVIHVKDIVLPSTLTVLSNPDDPIVRVARLAVATAEEGELEAEPGDVDKVEVIRKGKAEEEEGD